jgi:murein DD-endopeptidase MepM/ murein hydrolase activator NlpD
VPKPNLSLQLEPLEGGKIRYLPLAPSTQGGAELAKLVLRLRITNQEAKAIRVKGITVAFPGSNRPSIAMQGVNVDGSLNLAPSTHALWSSGQVDLDPDPDVKDMVNNAMFIAMPVPSQGRVDITCHGFDTPASATFELAAHASPTPSGFYRFPYAAGELREDEYYTASASHWANGGAAGGQIFAHDIGVTGYDAKTGKWSGLVPGGSRLKNADYRIYGKPVRAMADGVVVEALDSIKDNVIKEVDGKLQFPDPTPSPVSGNHIFIQHGTEVVKYCHLQRNSIPAALKVKGAKVWAGQKVGLVGNTGNSTNPHTHVECERDSTSGPLRPLVFGACAVIAQSALKPPSDAGPWVGLHGQGISKDGVLIWPGSMTPGSSLPAVGIARSGDWANSYYIHGDLSAFSKHAQSLFDDRKQRMIHVANFVDNGQRYWLGISRSGDWANRWFISNGSEDFVQDAQKHFDEDGLRLTHAWPYQEGGATKIAGIARGGTWASRILIRNDLASFSREAQALFDDHGLRLIQVRTYLEGGVRKWLGIMRSGDWANRWWISPDWPSFVAKSQTYFDHDGLRLVHVTSYVDAGKRKWLGIARSGDWGNRLIQRPDLDLFNLNAQQYFEEDGLRLLQVEVLG